jgi:hypothetical protein
MKQHIINVIDYNEVVKRTTREYSRKRQGEKLQLRNNTHKRMTTRVRGLTHYERTAYQSNNERKEMWER